MENIINDWLKCYLIGPMEKTLANDGGRTWRQRITDYLNLRIDSVGNPVYVFDPTKEETNKIGIEPGIFHKKVQGWLASGHNDKIAENGKLIWKGKTFIEKGEQGQARLIHIMGDCDYVVNSNFLIARMEPGDEPCGTYSEAGIAIEHNIPIYVIQTMPRTEYKGSFVQMVYGTGGAFFNTEAELLNFLDEKYKLKIKK